MTSLIALGLVLSVFCGVIAILAFVGEKLDSPIERFERRWPKQKGFER